MYNDHEPDDTMSPENYVYYFSSRKSALRASSKHNPRNLPCPTCGCKNRLTPADRAKGYQCDTCANRNEGMGGY